MAAVEKCHAVIPKYRQGLLIPDNLALLTRPLHAFHHFLVAADQTEGEDRKRNIGGVGMIVTRMSLEELVEFTNLIHLDDIKRRAPTQ